MDQTARWVDAVRTAAGRRTLVVSGTGTKAGLLPPARGEMLSTVEHTGVLTYEPAELVITARTGTPLKDLQLELARHNQELAADPPQFNGQGTVGGAVAAGLSGPARAWRGSLRDAVLGVSLINGRGEELSFGGQVMKNVAGYDVSRLMAGAWGSLALLTSVSLRVQPRAERTATLVFEMDAQQGIEQCRSLARQPLPLTGSLWCDDVLYLRFSGTEAALRAVAQRLGGDALDDTVIWQQARDQQLAFFREPEAEPLWRVSAPPAAALPDFLNDAPCVEWGGALRWFRHGDAAAVISYAQAVGGWAWRPGDQQPLAPAALRVMQALAHAFDPEGVFASGLFQRPAIAPGAFEDVLEVAGEN